MKPFRFSGLHHTAFATSDMEKTIRYWRDLLGFHIVFGMKDKDQQQLAFRISDQMMVFFFEWKEVEPVKPKRHGEPVKGPFIFDHLAIHVETEEELHRLQDQFICAELPVSDKIDHGFLHSIYTFDPNGIPLEFTWIVPEIDLDKEPVYIAESHRQSGTISFSPVPGQWPVCEEDEEEERIILPGKEQKYFQNR